MEGIESWSDVNVAVHTEDATGTIYIWIDEERHPAQRTGCLFPFKLTEIDDRACRDNTQEGRE